jgi:hypothetical protein
VKNFKLMAFALVTLVLAACQSPLAETDSLDLTGQSRAPLPNDAPVVLEYARLAWHTAAPGEYIMYIEGIVNLKNIAYEKELTVFSAGANGVSSNDWTTTGLTNYLGQDDNGYEQWEFRTYGRMMGSVVNFDFAFEYKVNGQTYWDNNSGRNYNIRVGRNEGRIYDGFHGVLNNGPIVLNKILYPGFEWQANILVKNLAYVKNVQMHYSDDDWATTTSVPATYSRVVDTVNDIEEWLVRIPRAEAEDIEFYFSYDVNGVTYYDNSRGQNYHSDALWGVDREFH